MQNAFLALLASVSGVTAVVPASRIEWGLLQQGCALPALGLHLIDHAPGMTLTGSDGFWRGRVQIDVYADTYAVAKAVAEAVADGLHGYRGGGFQMIALDAQRNFTEATATSKPQRISLDFLTIWSKQDG